MNCFKGLLSSLLAISLGAGAACAASSIDTVPSTATENFSGMSEEGLAKTFQGYQAGFVILDTKTQQSFRFNPKLCSTRFSPCSTFKIFNSLAGLETGVLQDENHSMKWDGTKYSISDWNHDQTLQSAVSNSVVWYFQHVASGVGAERMKEFLQKTHYGNEDISGGITKFWLGSSLKISPDEQVQFIERLVKDELPFSKRSMAIVRGLLRRDQTTKGTLYGKTGSDMIDGKGVLGWFVGYVAQPDRIYVFVTNIQAADGASGKKARDLTEKILTESGLL